MRLVDTHVHLNFDSYDSDREAVYERAATAGVSTCIIPAIDLETSRLIPALCDAHPGLYAAVGIHPNSTADFDDPHIDEIAAQAAHPRVVSIGEIGLDYHWDKSPKAQQFRAFEAQLALAARLELPVIIHNREANDDTLAILSTWVQTLPASLQSRAGVLHSFSGDLDMAEKALALGFYLGFTGPITYKNAEETRRIAAAAPLDRLLVETDGPFLTPIPHRGKRNEPAYIPLIIERLAAVRQSTPEALAAATTANAARLFRLPD